MPPRGLPGNANLEQLKNGAKSFQRAVRAGDAGAAEVVNEFHPRLADAQPGSPELNGFTRTDAQLVVARQFGFPSWPKLKAHLELVARYARSPHHEPIGEPLTDDQAVVDEFLRLACLNYGDDDPDRFRRAELLLQEHEWLARASIHTIAATGEVDAARELLDRDPSQASLVGGPHGWEPLLYLTYSRVPLGPGRSGVGVARLLLEHGADPNAGYLWEGLIPPFTALTGALGGGGTIPKHEEELALARLLLQAGADANDGQALYNQGWGPQPGEDWLELLFEFGLGTGDGGPWRRRLGRAAGLTAEDARGSADRRGESRAHRPGPPAARPRGGSRGPRDTSTRSIGDAHRSRRRRSTGTWTSCRCWSTRARPGSTIRSTSWSRPRWPATAPLWSGCSRADPACAQRAIERCPDQLVRAAEQDSYEAVALLIELGFDVNARSRTAPLHEAAMRGNVAVIRLLLDHGADPNIHDTGYDATPAGWAEHHGQPEAQQLLEALEHAAPPTRGRGRVRSRPTQPGAAMRTVTAAFTAVSEGRFDELGSMLAAEIDWQGLPDEDGQIPRCRGRDAGARTDADRPARQQRGVGQRVRRGGRPRPRARAPGR